MATPPEKVKPKLRVLFSLKLANWYRVGQQLSFNKLTLERLNNDYKGDKEECKKRMFGYWLRCCEEPSYERLMQALVNAGETVAAENLHKKSGATISKPIARDPSETLKNLGHVSLVYSGPSKEAKKKIESITTEFLEEKRTEEMQKFRQRLARVRDLVLFQKWQQIYSILDGDFPSFNIWLKIDMGEIAEVQEIGPILLTSSNTFHFVCLDCRKSLSAQVSSTEASIRHQPSYQSSETMKDFLHQTLHTINSLWSSLKSQFSSKGFAAVLVGDNVGRSQERVSLVDREIQASLKECGCCQGREIKYSHYREGKMIHPIDQSENNNVKVVLRQIGKYRTDHMYIPQSCYKLLCICFFGKLKVMEYSNFEELAVVCGVNRRSVEELIQYIHDKSGIILHYPDVPSLSNFVICKPQILLDTLSHLLSIVLQSNPEIRTTGVIKKCLLENFEDAASSHMKFLTPKSMIELLKHYYFLSELRVSEEIFYFMPFLLHSDSLVSESHTVVKILQSLYPSPMIINFDTGHIPVGIFYGLVVQLSKAWNLTSEMQYKNRITFQFEGDIKCMLVAYPNCLEVRVIGASKSCSNKLFHYIQSEITDILQLLLSFYNHTEDVKHTIQFLCPRSLKDLHFASIIPSSSTQCKCNNIPTPCTLDGVVPLTESIAAWFANKQELLELSSSTVTAKSTFFPDENDKIINLLQTHIAQEGSIWLRAGKSLLYGPPNVGKTSSLMRLTGEIENLGQVMPPTSTGIEKAITVNLYHTTETKSVTIADTSNCWKPQDIESQISTIINCVLQSRDTLHTRLPAKSPKIGRSKSSSSLHQFLNDDKMEETMEVNQSESERDSISVSSPSSVSVASPEEMQIETVPSPAINPDHGHISQMAKKNNPDLSLILGNMIKYQKWKEVQKMLQNVEDITLLQIIDTGGQPEFHEILPLLLTGPALYFIFINLMQFLDEQYEIIYTQEEGTVSPIKYHSILTIKEMLLQLLMTINSMSLSSDKSSALILGTHKDQVFKEKIVQLEHEIKSNKDFDVYMRKNTLKQFTVQEQSQVLFPLDNKDGTQEEIQLLRDALNKIIRSHFRPEELPTSWYLFYLALRKIYENNDGICPIDEAVSIGSSFGISEESIKSVLKYFHNRFGTILFYPEIPSLNGWVICDPNVIFKPISLLIAASFGENTENPMLVEQIRRSGQFRLSLIERVLELVEDQLQTSSAITAPALIDLMEYHNIISEVQAHDNSLVYFMPCLLRPDTNIREETSEQVLQLDHAPFVIQFPLGCIPVGLFPALIVHLSRSKEWILQYYVQQYKNRVSFIGDRQTMSVVDIILQMDRIELRVDCKNVQDARRLCVRAYQDVENALQEMKESFSFMRNLSYEFGFHCPALSQPQNETHFAVCYDLKKPLRMLCSVNCKEKAFDLQQKHKMWFAEHDDPEEDMEVVKTLSPPKNHRLEVETLLKENQVDSRVLGCDALNEIFKEIPKDVHIVWDQLGILLDITYSQRETIKEEYRQTGRCFSAMLDQWLRTGKASWANLVQSLNKDSIGNYSEVAYHIAINHLCS